MNLHKGTGALPPVLAEVQKVVLGVYGFNLKSVTYGPKVQKVVADIQLRGLDNLMDLLASKAASVHGDTLVDSFDLSYQKISMTSEGGYAPPWVHVKPPANAK